MAKTPKMNENDNTQDVEDLTVATIEFPFNMPTPDFGSSQDIDGTVLYLNDIETSDENMVVFKALDDGLIHLVADQTPMEMGVVDTLSSFGSPELMGYHYYVFQDELTIYSEQALVLL